MTEQTRESIRQSIRDWLNLTAIATLVALALSLYNFYRSYLYVSEQLDITVSEVSYMTNKRELYMILAFSNPGNRDAAVLRVEPLLWRRGENSEGWQPLADKVPDIPLTAPRTPLIVRSGGVEVVTLSTQLDPAEAERFHSSTLGGAFVGVRVATMNASGNLFEVEHTVARLDVDGAGTISGAGPAIHTSLPAFSDVRVPPPGDQPAPTRQTPFVWADQHWTQ